MNIECCINNMNADTYNNLMFRKFFQIIFINENMKELDIYTATILGGRNSKLEDEKYENYYSRIDNDFKVQFGFNVENEEKCEYDIISEDLTNQFIEQFSKTKLIWGKDSEEVQEQTEIGEKLKEIFEHYKNADNCQHKNKCDDCDKKDESCYQAKIHGDCTSCKNYMMEELDETKYKATEAIYVSDEKKKECALAVKGECDIEKKDKDKKREKFILKSSQIMYKGIEIVNWVHTKIKFNRKQNFDRIDYIIKFPEGVLWTPDFTLYVGPPEGTFVDLNTSGVKVEGLDIRDALQEVGTYKELYYEEWKKNCNIMNKRMFRVLKDKVINMQEKKFKKKEIELVINLKDEGGKEKSQFILGIIISTLLAFGIDSTRMDEVKWCFPFRAKLQDVQWLGTCILLVCVLMKSWKCNISFIDNIKNIIKERRHFFFATIIGFLGISLCVSWFIVTFILFRMDIFSYNENVLDIVNARSILLVIGWGLCIAYLFITNCWLKQDYSSLKTKYKIRF